MDIDQIVNDAIPQDTCPRKEAEAKERRRVLRQRIEKIRDERDRKVPYQPDLEYKEKAIPVRIDTSEDVRRPWGIEPINTTKNSFS